MTHRDVAYLNHILDAISDIEESVGSHSKEEFLELKDVRDANVRRLEIIGEATKNVSTSMVPRPWRISSTRTISGPSR